MDETLLHAATINDIYVQQIYGPDPRPDFFTSFEDQGNVIEIGVFQRPYLAEMLQRILPYFQICVYTASEQLYADAILDVIDPNQEIFFKRLYRTKCVKASVPSNHN